MDLLQHIQNKGFLALKIYLWDSRYVTVVSVNKGIVHGDYILNRRDEDHLLEQRSISISSCIIYIVLLSQSSSFQIMNFFFSSL
jgi:hypothetical protein